MKKISLRLLLFMTCLSRVFAFGYYNDIIVKGSHSVQYIYLNEDMYRKSGEDFRDMALYDANGKEIPWILEKYREESVREITGTFPGEIRQDDKPEEGPREIVIRFEETKTGLVPVGNRLQLKLRDTPDKGAPFPGEDFTIKSSADGKNWETLTPSAFSLKDNQLSFFLETGVYPWIKVEAPPGAERNHKKYLSGAQLQLEEEFVRDAPEIYAYLNFADVTYGAVDNEPNATLLQVQTGQMPVDRIRLYSYTQVDSDYAVYDGELPRTALQNPLSRGRLFRSGGREELEIPLDRERSAGKLYIKFVNRNGDFGKINAMAMQGRFYPDRLYFRATTGRGRYRLCYGAEDYKSLRSPQLLEDGEALKKMLRTGEKRDPAEVGKTMENINFLIGDVIDPEDESWEEFPPEFGTGEQSAADAIIITGISILLAGFSWLLVKLLIAQRNQNRIPKEGAAEGEADCEEAEYEETTDEETESDDEEESEEISIEEREEKGEAPKEDEKEIWENGNENHDLKS
ncbi:MAG: hypothetical protein LBQ96_05730 [Fusobacteriaceae bacterium]|nr:hypothetical protein [Fusobacteriaceae bacterium]